MLELKQEVAAALTDDKEQKERAPLHASLLFHANSNQKADPIKDVSFPSSIWNRDNSRYASKACYHAAPIGHTMQKIYKRKLHKKSQTPSQTTR